MKKSKADYLINLSMEIVRHLWVGDVDFIDPYLDGDACYIASCSSGLFSGKTNIKEELYRISENLTECAISQQEFMIVTQDRRLCVIVGHYLLTISEGGHEPKKSRRRATFIWKDHSNGEPGITHLHFSGSIHDSDIQKSRVKPAAAEENGFSKKLNSAFEGSGDTITVKGVDGKIRIIPVSEIEYAEAKDHNTCLYFVNHEGMPQREENFLCVRIDWKYVKDLLSRNFVTVSRSFAVNYRYIKSFNHHEIEMDSGARISIPRNKYTDVEIYLERKYSD